MPPIKEPMGSQFMLQVVVRLDLPLPVSAKATIIAMDPQVKLKEPDKELFKAGSEVTVR